MIEKLSELFEAVGLDWYHLCGLCTVETPSMLGSQSGFVTLIKQKAPRAFSLHRVIHRQALASKTLPATLKEILDTVIRTVNFVKPNAPKLRLFKKLLRSTCKYVGCPKAVFFDVYSHSEQSGPAISLDRK